MTSLDKKCLRDLWHLKTQAFAVALVIASGVATFVMSLCMLSSLENTLTAYYERHHFAEIFTHVKRAPNSLSHRIAEIPGVRNVQTRIVERAILEVAGFAEPVVGRLVSIDDVSMLNGRYLREGRAPRRGRESEVLINDGFAKVHGLHPGDTLYAVINGRKRMLRVVGVALSPEFVYQIREGDFLPDERRFGVLWMRYEELAAAFDMDGAFNDVALSLYQDAVSPEVILKLDRLLQGYGSLGAYDRSEQPSHRFVTNELKELRGVALVIPSIFLSVAAFLLNVVVSRLVSTQREQIAALKAFGYSNWELAQHYLKLVLSIVGVGTLLGVLVGAKLGHGLTGMYARFFHFPTFSFSLTPRVVLLAIVVSVSAGIAGTLFSVIRATRLPTAEAMRPEAPARYRRTSFERIGLAWLLSPGALMVLRKLERQPIRAILSIIGIALSVSVVVLGNFSVDAINYVMESEFSVAQRHDVAVAFGEASTGSVLSELQSMPGVTFAEPFRQVPVRLSYGHRTRRVGVTGVNPEGGLFRIIDIRRRVVALPEHGIVLSTKLAEVLGVRAGQWIWMEILEGRRPRLPVYVSDTLDDFAGLAGYVRLDSLQTLLQEEDSISGAYLAVDELQKAKLYQELKNIPYVASVTIKDAALQSFRKTIAENLLQMRLFNLIFACIIAVGVVYNTARVSLSERGRELATLRVVGFTINEISSILFGELALLTLVGIPVGLVVGHVLAAVMIETTFDTELFRIPLIIERSTYGFAAAVTLVAAVVSAGVVRRRLNRLDLVGVLKSRE